MSYLIREWILFFIIYSFLGWIIESTIVSFSSKRLINRGMLRGPVLPIYGFGAVSILLLTVGYKDNIFQVFINGMIAATILEYIAGTLIEMTLKMKYWDYSYAKIQFQGKICLKSSLFWGVLSVVLTYTVHIFVEAFVKSFAQETQLVFANLIAIIYLTDAVISIREAINITKVLTKLTEIKAEADRLMYLAHATQKKAFVRLLKVYPTIKSKKFNSVLKDVKNKIGILNKFKH